MKPALQLVSSALGTLKTKCGHRCPTHQQNYSSFDNVAELQRKNRRRASEQRLQPTYFRSSGSPGKHRVSHSFHQWRSVHVRCDRQSLPPANGLPFAAHPHGLISTYMDRLPEDRSTQNAKPKLICWTIWKCDELKDSCVRAGR